MFASKVRVRHRRAEVAVTHGFLHVHRVLPLGEPRGDPPMSQVVLMQTSRKLGALRRRAEAITQGLDASPTAWATWQATW